MEVVAIISGREGGEAMKRRVESLYALFRCDPEAHMEAARYTSPAIPYPAEFFTTNTGVPHQATIHRGDNPWLVAAYSTNVALS